MTIPLWPTDPADLTRGHLEDAAVVIVFPWDAPMQCWVADDLTDIQRSEIVAVLREAIRWVEGVGDDLPV